MKKKRQTKISRWFTRLSSPKKVALLFIPLFALAAAAALVLTRAANPSIAVEAESGTKSGPVQNIANANASGGQAVRFGTATAPGTVTFLETFDGAPAAPQPWNPDRWDWTVHSRDFNGETFDVMEAEHGSMCEPPTVTHTVDRFDQAIFGCRDHLMTAIKGEGYALIYITPNHLVDFTNGEAVIKMDVSTFRASHRDWWDLWVTPYEDHLQLAGENWYPDLAGEPKRAVHIRMDQFNGHETGFHGRIINNFQEVDDFVDQSSLAYEQFLTPDKARRDTFELRISKTHIKFGMPAYNKWWIDRNVSGIDFTQGVVQFGHHSYNPDKDDTFPGTHAGTWHWDNASISPAIPFTIIKGTPRSITSAAGSASGTFSFSKPAPTNAKLRFSAQGANMQFSTNGGTTWTTAHMQASGLPNNEHFTSYFTDLPAGINSVKFKGQTNCCTSQITVRDVSIWARP